MKKLTVKGKISAETKLDSDSELPVFDVRELLILILNTPLDPRQGSTFDYISGVTGLIRKIRDAKADTILIETDEHNKLMQALKAFRLRNDPALYEWIKDIGDLPDVPVKEK